MYRALWLSMSEPLKFNWLFWIHIEIRLSIINTNISWKRKLRKLFWIHGNVLYHALNQWCAQNRWCMCIIEVADSTNVRSTLKCAFNMLLSYWYSSGDVFVVCLCFSFENSLKGRSIISFFSSKKSYQSKWISITDFYRIIGCIK